MTIKSYIKKLQKLAEIHPTALVICASDEEGNSFNEVIYDPQLVYFDKEQKEVNDVQYNGFVKAICLN